MELHVYRKWLNFQEKKITTTKTKYAHVRDVFGMLASVVKPPTLHISIKPPNIFLFLNKLLTYIDAHLKILVKCGNYKFATYFLNNFLLNIFLNV